ncbi:hypothetical protein [Mycolicibacterium sp.]|uniref:hypothetical protein n=1 Tax=Mycolicibacterium sp. TaxID=2320850 RepID=UPI0028B13639|nr:hypothetical protein [Mycolicibacterium sp.]
MSHLTAVSGLDAAAFGDDPGRWPLPPAQGHRQLWLRAIAAGGQGRYADANAGLAELLRGRPESRLASLALSTRASFLRQLGWHWRAHDWDGRAWALAGDDPEASADALAGLAADALGVGRLGVSADLLSRATDVLTGAGAVPPRLKIRLAWVGAELAMASGDGRTAVSHARRGVELAENALPVLRRHRVKSDVVLAAALCCAGDLAASRALADSALVAADSHALVPLRWALACLLAGIGSAVHSQGAIVEVRDRSAEFVTRHGGRWRMPGGRP